MTQINLFFSNSDKSQSILCYVYFYTKKVKKKSWYYSAIKRNDLLILTEHEYISTHCAKWKKPDKKDQILYDSIYMKF